MAGEVGHGSCERRRWGGQRGAPIRGASNHHKGGSDAGQGTSGIPGRVRLLETGAARRPQRRGRDRFQGRRHRVLPAERGPSTCTWC
jgi:hypothetical protein